MLIEGKKPKFAEFKINSESFVVTVDQGAITSKDIGK
jgi:hypothetical protein